MKQWIVKFGFLITLVIIFAITANYYHVSDYLSLGGFNHYRLTIMDFELKHPAIFITGYIVSYILLIVLCIPGTILFDLIAGFIFGWYLGVFLVIFSYEIGAFLNFLLIRYFFKDLLANRFNKFKSLIHGEGRYGLMINLISLRLIAVIPFWVLNIVAALLNIRASVFLISTLIGILPSSIIYVVIGDGVREVLNQGQDLSADILVNPKIWAPLFIMAIILMLPNLIKRYKQSKASKNN